MKKTHTKVVIWALLASRIIGFLITLNTEERMPKKTFSTTMRALDILSIDPFI
jgi:hypothetical protein